MKIPALKLIVVTKSPPSAEWLVCGPTDWLTTAALGLESRVWSSRADPIDFRALAQGFTLLGKAGKAPLVQNAGSKTRVALHDFTLSTPKSVSVIWALSDQVMRRMIEQAQRRAAHAFLQLLGNNASYSRQGRGGRIKTPCSLVSALFPHFVSRGGDPQIHTHCTLLNVAVRPDETTGSLETLGIMGQLGVAATQYHEVLAEGMQQIGFSIRQCGNLFEVDGVPDHVCKAFSQRRAAALADATAWMSTIGVARTSWEPSRSLMRKSVLRTRPVKQTKTVKQLTIEWLRRAELLDFHPAHLVRNPTEGVLWATQAHDEMCSSWSGPLRETG